MSSPRRTATAGAVGEHETLGVHGAFEVHFAVRTWPAAPVGEWSIR